MVDSLKDAQEPSLAEIDAALAAVLNSYEETSEPEDALRATSRAGLMRVLGLWFRDSYPPQPPFDDPTRGRGREAQDDWDHARGVVIRANGSAFIDEIEAGRVPFDHKSPWGMWGVLDIVINLAAVNDPRALPLIERYAKHPDWLLRYHITRSRAVNALLRTLSARFIDRSDAFVAANAFVYFREGGAIRRIHPDAFIALGVPQLPTRLAYRIWQEGVPPTVVIDVLGLQPIGGVGPTKDTIYRHICVQEYFVCRVEYENPRHNSPDPQFAGYCRQGDTYVRIAPEADGALRSEALGLLLRREEGGRLALFDARTGERLLPDAG